MTLRPAPVKEWIDFDRTKGQSGITESWRKWLSDLVLELNSIDSDRLEMSRMPDGTSGLFLEAQGDGIDPIYAAVSSTLGGSDTQVQFNDGGVLGGDSTFVWDKTDDRLTIRNSPSSNMPWSSTQPLPPLGFALGVGSSGSPVSTMKLAMEVEKWSNGNIIGAGIPDQTAQFTLEKSAGDAAGVALMGFGNSYGTNSGDVIGTAGFAYNQKTSGGGNVYGGWFVAIDYGQQANYLTGAEFAIRPQIDRGHKTAVAAGLSIGCWVAGAGYPYSWAFATGVEVTGGKAHTGFMITQDSIVPFAGGVNEAIRIRGGSTEALRYGCLIGTDYLEYGIDFSGATIYGNKAIVLAAGQTVDGRDISADLDQAVKTTSGPTFDHLNLSASLYLPDLTPIYMNAKNAMYFNGTTIVIGTDSLITQLYIAGVSKVLSVDASGFVKAA